MPFAVITGASEGIGHAVAEKFLSAGWDIAICARGEEGLQKAKDSWQAEYPSASILTVQTDLARKEEVQKFAAAVSAAGKTVNVLVNNAGIFLQGDLATEPEGQLQTLMDVNLYSAYHLTRALLPAMKKQGSGHIFNICSVASLRAYPAGGAYSITKYALLGFSDNLREELKTHNIRVTALCPGATWSRSWSSSGVAPERIMQASDIATMIWASYNLSAAADVENIIMRPVGGDL